MTIPYCTCEKHSKELFSTFFLIVGSLVYSLMLWGVYMLATQPPAELLYLLLIPPILAWLTGNWYARRRQALFLGHSPRCANRYALLAAISSVRGNDSSYGGLKGYKSATRTALEQTYGKRATRKIYKAAAVCLVIALAGIFILVEFDGLWRQRNGLPALETRYGDPVMSVILWTAIFIPVGGLVLYMHGEKRVNSKKRYAAAIAVGCLAVWLALAAGATSYARVGFWPSVGSTLGVLALAGIAVGLVVVIENAWRSRRKKRRKKTR